MGRPRQLIPPPQALKVSSLDEDLEFVLVEWQVDPATEEALTTAERDVLEAIARGDSNATIATSRGTSARTVANQVATLLKKLNAGSRYELIRRFGGRHAR
jgi:DNA-binding NarL/FixJ family response regulator